MIKTSFGIEPLTGTFGAEINGLDLATVNDATFADVSKALDQYKVLVFRDQPDVPPGVLLQLASRFGDVEIADHPQHDHLPGYPGVKVLHSDPAVDHYDEPWHTDGATRTNTRWLTILRAVDIPDFGRDTVFADMEAVFDRLSPPMQKFLGSLQAHHTWGQQKPDDPGVYHDVVSTHPATGRRSLYVSKGYTRSLVGLNSRESQILLEYLFQQAYSPLVQLRVRWRIGTVVLWDNKRTQHYLVMDQPYPRVMHRVMVCQPEI